MIKPPIPKGLVLSDIFFPNLNLNEYLKNILKTTVKHFHGTCGYILRKNDENTELELLAGVHEDSAVGKIAAFSKALTAKTLQAGSGIAVKDAAADKDFATDPDFQRFNINLQLAYRSMPAQAETACFIWAALLNMTGVRTITTFEYYSRFHRAGNGTAGLRQEKDKISADRCRTGSPTYFAFSQEHSADYRRGC